MKEKEAREIQRRNKTKRIKHYDDGMAMGYLEAIEKAKGLVVAMEEVIEAIDGCYEGDVLKEALAKWEKKK